MMDIDTAARKIFKTDNSAVAQRDRISYRCFDCMPPGLQQWWRDRAVVFAKECKYGLSLTVVDIKT